MLKDNIDNPFNAYSCQCDIETNTSGWLVGKRVAVKDNIAIAGIPLSNGSYLIEGYIPDEDSTVVKR